jgi:serine/threonine protein kinase
VRQAQNALWSILWSIWQSCLKWYERRGNSSLDPALNTHKKGRQSTDLEQRSSSRRQCEPDSHTLIGQTIHHYRVLEKLGGGMGEVYLCKDTHLKRKVSLKFLPVEFPDDTKSVEQIGQDAKAVSALRHPNICTVQEIRKHNAQHFVVMEPLEGQTLRDYILSGKHLETAKVIDLASQITDALDIAHQNGIIHRAIKAENIFITKEGQAKILNFALTCLDSGSNSLHVT